MKKIITIFSIILFAFSLSAQKSVKLGLRSAGSIGVGDKFQITVTLVNIDGEPKLKSVPGAKLLYPDPVCSGSGSSMVAGTNIKTQSQTWTEYTFTLKATEKGTFSVGPITVNGVKSNVLKYNIDAESHAKDQQQQRQPQQRQMPDFDVDDTSGNPQQGSGLRFVGKGNDNLFMRAEVSKTTAYEQEAILYTVKLYTTYAGISFIGATESPKFDGFVLEESKNTDASVKLETYKGKTYKTAVIARYIIFPQMTGSLKVLGNKYTIAVRAERHYYDPIFGDLYPSYPQQLSVQPNDVSVNVIPLPTPKPANFSGGVGKFSITSSLPNKSLATNQAASIVYTISGTGNIKYVTLPDLSSIYPPQLEVYSPTSTVDANTTANSMTGSVKYDYSFMPMQEGTYQIPRVELVYFNPETKQYETAYAKGYTINVAKGKDSSKSQTREKAVFNPNLMEVGALSHSHSLFAGTLGYWLAYIIPFLALLIIAFCRRAYIKANADIIAVRSRKAGRVATKRLKKAAACMKRGDVEAFYDEILSSLWGFAADKLKMPGSELNRDNIRDNLTSRGVENDVIDDFIRIIDESEFAKYAPGSAAAQMNDTYSKASDIINAINKSIK